MRQMMGSKRISSATDLSPTRQAGAPYPPPADSGVPVDTGGEGWSGIQVKWMTIEDVTKHIQCVEECETAAALQRFREAMGACALATQWDDAEDRYDYPPMSRDFWLTVPIVLEQGGRVLLEKRVWAFRPIKNAWTASVPRWRRLLVDRKAVLRRWPVPQSAPGSSRSLEMARPRRPSIAEIARAAEAVYAQNYRPNIVVAERMIRAQLPGAARTLIRQVLNEERFAVRRKPPGNQPAGAR